MAKPPRSVRTRVELISLEERDVPAGTTSSALSNLNSSQINQLTTSLNTAGITTSGINSTTGTATSPTTGTSDPTGTTATTTPTNTSGSSSGRATTTTPTATTATTATTTSPPPPAAPPAPTFLPDREAKGNALFVDSSYDITKTVAAFESTFTGGAWVSRADVTGDGVADAIVGAGPGGAPVVRVIDGRDGRIVRSFNAYEDTFAGGVIVTTMDINHDGRADIITGTDQGGGARVRVFNGLDNSVMADFFAIEDTNFRGGVRVAMGDINNDGIADLVATAGYGGGPRVAVFDGVALLGGAAVHLTPDFFAFEPSLHNGVYVSMGDIDGDKHADLIFGAGPGGAPRVLALNGAELLGTNPADVVARPMFDFFAGLGDDRGGVRVGAINRTDGRVDVMAVGGTGGDATIYDVDTHKVSKTVNREIAYGAGIIDDRMAATTSTSGSSTGNSTGDGTTTGTGTGTDTGTPGTTGTGTIGATATSAIQQFLNQLGLGTTTAGLTTGTGGGRNGAGGNGTGG